jgi:protein ImuA
VIRRWRNDAERASGAEPSAATTRWRVTAAPSLALPAPGIGRERWLVELTRCKGAEARAWTLEACDAKGRLALPSDVADRSLPQVLQRRTAA